MPDIFDDLIKNRKNGKWIDSFEEECFAKLKEALTPAVALAIKT
jgi:hypothetical protein